MGFKKSNIKKSKFIPNLIWSIALCIVFFAWFVLAKSTNIFDLNFNNNTGTTVDEKKIQKNKKIIKDDGKKSINILVLWRWWGDHDAPNLTDTIILANINFKTKIISMLSIPRDVYVEFPDGYKDWKINWLYARLMWTNNSKKDWINAIKNKVTEITWEKIDYYINIDFEGFKKIIDTIWWVEITIPENFVDNRYPDWNWWYRTLVFKEWVWTLDWDNALKYARSRHSTSDFDRSNRQQQIIKAIKDKLNWSYFLTSPWKVKELYEVFINYVDTDLTLTTMIKLAYNLNWKWEFKIISSNLNDSCYYWSASCIKGWFLYTPSRALFGWMSTLMFEWTDIKNLNNFETLHKFSEMIFHTSWVFIEEYKVNIFNWAKVRNLASKLSNDIIKYWFNIPEKKSIWNADKIYEKSVIYYNNIDENSDTIKALKKFFSWEFIKTETPMFSIEEKAKIEIIIWDDYNTVNNPFKF
jgi:LCP family protein required for cell wall assembly